jgi:hypothetical protein
MHQRIFSISLLIVFFVVNPVFAQEIPTSVVPPAAPKAPPSEPYIAISPDYFYTLEEILYIEGRSDPNAIVTITLQKQGERPIKFTIKADSLGEWVVAEKAYLSAGNWQVRARQLVGTLVSGESNPRVIRSVVTGVDIFGVRIRYVVIGIIIFLFLGVLTGVFIYFRRRIKLLQKSMIQKQLQQTEEKIHHGFSEIRKDLMDQLKDLAASTQNRTLTADEVARRDHILGQLEELEKNLDHDLGDIQKRNL